MVPALLPWTIKPSFINGGKIASVGPAGNVHIPAGAKTIDMTGYTVLPGLVGMHDHLFFPMGGNPPIYSDMGISFPRLYLALGVTTIRTTGSVAPYTDLEIKQRIDSGQMIGPKMDVRRRTSRARVRTRP